MDEVHKGDDRTDCIVAHSEHAIDRCAQPNTTKELNHRKASPSISHIAKRVTHLLNSSHALLISNIAKPEDEHRKGLKV